ncbi:class II myosin [Malassezia equina]|uniref:Class II myosin n=1 Tax=Malassezia equina TaxID=1381935 RepID=A0AAF0J3S6_9BASI|nr:class II myosin [Malassezia equina]
MAAYVVREMGDMSECCLSTGTVVSVPTSSLSEMNPPKFDKVADIADLTYLNEASVVHNLRQRFFSNLIYTYSGLFLVAVNPYHALPIYTEGVIEAYKNKRREENAPHIFAVADGAMRNMLEGHENQSLLITGESGAGKTENTKRVIQYLAATAVDADAAGPWHAGEPLGLLERQILQANPILESFGNAQTVRNNNSSRFGKFIRIEFSATGTIAGGNIEWYLLEKSRVHSPHVNERNFHVFYQLLRSRDQTLLESLCLSSYPEHYAYLSSSRKDIEGVDDSVEFRHLIEALRTMGFTSTEEHDLFLVLALILHLGNLELAEDRAGQARITNPKQLELVSRLMGVEASKLNDALVRPTVRAGRESVVQARSKKQVTDEVAALCKTMYEKTFGWLVGRINHVLDRPTSKSQFIGVLDIAGFEIFETNSFEQLCINHTNEKLQQFFNRHMFHLEQQEYARESIEWDYVNFGLDLQPTIDLIESVSPVGILATLDEECIMPKATDLTFTEKLTSVWAPARNSPETTTSKFLPSRQVKRFVVRHYAANVEYSTDAWLDKNRDPLNDNVTRVLAGAEATFVASLFAEAVAPEETSAVPRSRRGAFRTVGQRHKEQLASLMAQLDSTQPHFVRCIVPNTEKRPGRMDLPLVLEQLRCNGVLEGIRIARLGYPNRLLFADFVNRYALLAPDAQLSQAMDHRVMSSHIAKSMGIDATVYKIGLTKIFFKAGVLAELEEQRDACLHDLFTRFQAAARRCSAQRLARKRLRRNAAMQTLRASAQAYKALDSSPWWRLYMRLQPLLSATQDDEEAKRHELEMAMARERAARDELEKTRLAELEAKLRQSCALLEEQLDDARTQQASLGDTLRATEERLTLAEAQIAEAHAERDEGQRELQALQQQLDESVQREKEIQTELSAISDLLDKELNTRVALEHEHNDALSKAARVEEALESARQSLKEHTERAEQHIQDLAEKHEAELDAVKASLSDAQAKSAQHDTLRARLTELEQAHTELQGAHKRAQEQVAEQEARWESAAKQRVPLEEALAEARAARDAMAERTEALEKALKETEHAHTRLQAKHEHVSESHAAQLAEARMAMEERDAARAELTALQRALDKERAGRESEQALAQERVDTAAKEREEHVRLLDERAAELKKANSKVYVLELENRRLESLQNKTTVEHVHVLEEAKKYTDRQLSDVQAELQELSTYTRSLERTRARMQQEHEVLARTAGGVSIEEAIGQRDEARAALEESQKMSARELKWTRAEYEAKIQRLEEELRRVQKNHHTEKALSGLGSGRKSHAVAARQVLAEIQMETELLAKDLARASALRAPLPTSGAGAGSDAAQENAPAPPP